MPSPPLDVATIFEGHYAAGLGALLNSLVSAGFTGTVWVGHRGELPTWLRDLPTRGTPGHHRLVDGVHVAPLRIDTARHLTNAKPAFLLAVLERSDAGGIAYLDADIVVRQPWPFFADWASEGVAVCADANPWFPATHPTRKAWLRLARELGDDLSRCPPVDLYVNAGFVACTRRHRGFLLSWERYLLAMAAAGPGLQHGPGAASWDLSYRWSPYLAGDQDALNLAVMAHADQVSMIGPQGMGLGPGWSVMSHAVGSPKPWQGSHLRKLLQGRAPTEADAQFLRHCDGAVQVYAMHERRARVMDLRLARALGRLAR